MMFNIQKLKLLFLEIIFFLIIQFFGIFIALNFMISGEYVSFPQLSIFWFIIAFIVMTLFIIFSMKYIKTGIIFKIAFIILIFTGVNYSAQIFFSNKISFFFSVLFIVLWILIDRVFMHDIAILFAIAGVGAQLGLSLTVGSVLILFAVLSIYDVFAVYKTRHMVKMFKQLSNKGVFLALIVPFNFKNFLNKTKKIHIGRDVLVLGTGDLVFPLIFAVSCLKISLMTSMFVVFGAVFGLIVIFYLLLKQSQRQALPALPPIAFGSLVGFIVSLIIQTI